MRHFVLVAAGALLLGFGSGEYLTGNFSFRRWIAQVVRREELRALVGRHGIYDRDIARAWEGELFVDGTEPGNLESGIANEQKRAVLGRLITLAKLNNAASHESIGAGSLDRQIDLLRWQMRDEKMWLQVLRFTATSVLRLRGEVARNLRARQWLENRIAPRIWPNEEECRRYFQTYRAGFAKPVRLRASHLFLAAPEGCPTEVIETKHALIDTLAKRLATGEAFPALVAEFSEDEATKKRGGDLGFFAAERMLPAVFEAAERLRPGETSPAIRSRLGFHIIRLTETRPAQALTFEEARPEIRTLLENQKRTAAIAGLIVALR